MSAVYKGDFGELRIEYDMIDVNTIGGNIPDKEWDYTDRQGHRHFYSDTEDTYPTLSLRHSTYFCGDCHDEHTDSWYVCRTCGETIQPGTKPDPKAGMKQYVPGLPEFWLNGEPISPERARELLGDQSEGTS